MLLWFPLLWLVVLPANFLIDSLVLLLCLWGFHIADKAQSYRRYIFKIFGFGLVADIIGSAYMLLMILVFDVSKTGDEWYLTLPALLISAAMIFILNCRFTFGQLDKPLRVKLALIFAVATAPYTFFVPTSWISG